MKKLPLIALTLALTGLVAPAGAPAGAQVEAVAGAAARPTITVDGDVTTVLRLSREDLRAMPQVRQEVDYVSQGVSEQHVFRGPRLTDVLAAAQPTFDTANKNDQLRFAVLVEATDGYQAVVSYAEIDPEFGGTPALLALREDGEGLKIPRLTVPGDVRGGRYVTDVATVQVTRVLDAS